MQIDITTAVREAGSPTKLAVILGLERRKGGQRVSQWLARQSIPLRAQVELAKGWRRLALRIARRNKRAPA